MNTNHHLSKPAMIGKLDASGTFEVVWRSINPIKASAWSRYLPDNAKRVADWTFPWVCGGCTEPTFIGDGMISTSMGPIGKLKDTPQQLYRSRRK
jgi:hypothetical protein